MNRSILTNQPDKGPTATQFTRRRFLKRGASTAVSISVVDLVMPLGVSAEDASCNGYYAGDPDEDCDMPATSDTDSGCKPPSAEQSYVDADGNCKTELSSGLMDNDGSCGFSPGEGQMDGDSSCGQLTSNSGNPENDEACDAGRRGSEPNDSDGNCSSAEVDELCKPDTANDPDARCGFGQVAQEDGNCGTAADPDDTCRLQPASDEN